MLASWCLAGFDVHRYFPVFSVLSNPFFLIVEHCFCFAILHFRCSRLLCLLHSFGVNRNWLSNQFSFVSPFRFCWLKRVFPILRVFHFIFFPRWIVFIFVEADFFMVDPYFEVNFFLFVFIWLLRNFKIFSTLCSGDNSTLFSVVLEITLRTKSLVMVMMLRMIVKCNLKFPLRYILKVSNQWIDILSSWYSSYIFPDVWMQLYFRSQGYADLVLNFVLFPCSLDVLYILVIGFL